MLAAVLLLCCDAPSNADLPPPSISKTAAKTCAVKVRKLEEFSRRPSSGKSQTTQFSEEEINSYLTLDLSSKFSPSLKSLVVRLKEGGLQGNALIDFDRLEMKSTEIATRLFAFMLSGVHELMVRGKLPVALVEEIITIIGRKQKPPFDPTSPSEMIYRIQRVDLHQGYMVVYQ
jgi:hypothetical protein